MSESKKKATLEKAVSGLAVLITNDDKKKKTNDTALKKRGKVFFEFDGQKIDYKAIEKKAEELGGDVYVVIAEKKIYDAEGKYVDLF